MLSSGIYRSVGDRSVLVDHVSDAAVMSRISETPRLLGGASEEDLGPVVRGGTRLRARAMGDLLERV